MNNDRSKVSLWRPTAVCLAVLSVFSTQAVAAVGEVFDYDDGKYEVPGEEEFDSMDVKIFPVIGWGQYFISAENGDVFTIKNKTQLTSLSTFSKNQKWEGTYTFYASGKKQSQESSINLLGDIDVRVEHKPKNEPGEGADDGSEGDGDDLEPVGANVFYAKDGGIITLGSDGTTTKAWVIAEIPDLISAKLGGSVMVKSKRNQFVGSIDFVEKKCI